MHSGIFVFEFGAATYPFAIPLPSGTKTNTGHVAGFLEVEVFGFRIDPIQAVRIAACVVLVSASSLSAQSWESQGQAFAELIRQARGQDWDAAHATARRMSDPVALSVFEWLRLRNGRDDWREYNAFLAGHSDWPGLKILRQSGERAIAPEDDPHLVVAYFRDQPPQSGFGALRLAEALSRLGRRAEAQDTIIDGWKSLEFEPQVQAEAISRFGAALRPHHAQRLDNLLWQDRHSEARAMFDLAGSGHALLARAREALVKEENGVNARIAAIPDRLRSDPGLAYDRVVWRLRNGEEDRAISLLLERSESAESLGKPELWASRRHRVAHSLVLKGKDRLAYRVASEHRLHPGTTDPSWLPLSQRERAGRRYRASFAELEWLSGYIALRRLDDPVRAAAHFRNFRALVESPISTAKAEFWLGISLAAAGDGERSVEALNRAGGHQTAFYGQLAAQLTGTGTDPGLLGSGRVPAGVEEFERVPVVRAGLLAHYAGEDSMAAWFLAHWAEELDGAGASALAALARRHGAEFSAIKVAKEGVRNGYVDIDHLFPLVGISGYRLPVPVELAISVARQETEFRDRAVSPKGAVGVMQIKPSTAEEVASNVGLSGNIGNLLRNRETNVLMGAAYLSERLEEFSGSYILAIAAYNAGPRRVAEWLAEIGDPREPHVDPIDWIEQIPFGETRNYVMRVLEALIVYRIRIGGTAAPIDIISYLDAG